MVVRLVGNDLHDVGPRAAERRDGLRGRVGWLLETPAVDFADLRIVVYDVGERDGSRVGVDRDLRQRPVDPRPQIRFGRFRSRFLNAAVIL